MRNFAEVNPADGRPWSSNKLRQAYAWGADRFGWYERHGRAKSDGPWLIGTGMATCSMGSFRFPATARVRLQKGGTVRIEKNAFSQLELEFLWQIAGQVAIDQGEPPDLGMTGIARYSQRQLSGYRGHPRRWKDVRMSRNFCADRPQDLASLRS